MTNNIQRIGELVRFPTPASPALPAAAYRDPRVIWEVRGGAHLEVIGRYPRRVDPRLAAQAVGAVETVQPNGPGSGVWHGEAPEWNLTIRMIPAADDAAAPATPEMGTESRTFRFSRKRDEVSIRKDKNERKRQIRFASEMLGLGYRQSTTVVRSDVRAERRAETDYYVQDLDAMLSAAARRTRARYVTAADANAPGTVGAAG